MSAPPLPSQGNLHNAIALRVDAQPSESDKQLLARLDARLARLAQFEAAVSPRSTPRGRDADSAAVSRDGLFALLDDETSA